MKNFFKKGSKVKVCVGKDKGKTGEIIEINRFRNLAKVKDVNMQNIKKATKENKGGIINKEGFYTSIKFKKIQENKKREKIMTPRLKIGTEKKLFKA